MSRIVRRCQHQTQLVNRSTQQHYVGEEAPDIFRNGGPVLSRMRYKVASMAAWLLDRDLLLVIRLLIETRRFRSSSERTAAGTSKISGHAR